MNAVALALLCAAAATFVVRLVIGPSLPDRIVALDGLLGSVAGAIVVAAVRTGATTGLTVVIVVTLIAFVGSAVAARFVERRGG